MSNPSTTIDKFGRVWNLDCDELCPTCGQPDNCGDCNHKPLTRDQVIKMGGQFFEDRSDLWTRVYKGTANA